MKRYEAYKDSCIEWLGEIPEHWEVCRTKDIVSLINDKATDTSLKKVALENIESKTGKYIDTDSEYESEGTLFQKDDILFGKLRPYLAKVYKAEFKGQSVGDIYVFRGKNDNNPDFLKYVFISDLFISVVEGSTYGAKMPRANWDFISNLRLAIPSIDEQRQISAYLDYKVSHIDSLISEKQKQVEDLQKYRSSIISEAVTRGLHPEVKMKDSGVEWIGRIPKHWDKIKVKQICSVHGRIGYRGYTSEDLVPNGEGAITIGGKNITNNVLNLSDADYISWEKYYESPEIMVHKGDLLMAQRGTLGRVALIKENIGEATINPSLVLLNSISDSIIKEYFYYYLVSENVKSLIGLLNTATAVPMISQKQIENIELILPSLSEQQEIVTYLDAKTSKIEATINELKTQIEDLRQYKTSIISEAVTGKVDLRGWKPK